MRVRTRFALAAAAAAALLLAAFAASRIGTVPDVSGAFQVAVVRAAEDGAVRIGDLGLAAEPIDEVYLVGMLRSPAAVLRRAGVDGWWRARRSPLVSDSAVEVCFVAERRLLAVARFDPRVGDATILDFQALVRDLPYTGTALEWKVSAQPGPLGMGSVLELRP